MRKRSCYVPTHVNMPYWQLDQIFDYSNAKYTGMGCRIILGTNISVIENDHW